MSLLPDRAMATNLVGSFNRVKKVDWQNVSWRDIAPGSDVGLAMGVVALLSVLILPLPTFLLDIGLALSVTSSVLVLMVALFLKSPRDFTSFPTLLLLTTLLRLSLEVATTRLILSHGNEGPLAAGHVVAAFGGFLMGGDVVIGVIVFVILLVVNFMVITKGSGRIAEVAARFSLDAMPGKQMAIDAELSSGAITDKVARRRRRELEEESGFYGAMDGAAKFVRGDAIASLLITGINIVGGLAIGLGRYGMQITDAASTFTTLTVGDGLVAQIPALLVSTAAGIVVTKGGTEGAADVALVRQLGGNAKPLAMSAGASALMAMMPGLPTLPFLALAALAAGAAIIRHRRPIDVTADFDAPPVPAPAVAGEPSITDTLQIDQLRLELGFNLLPLAAGDSPRLTEQIKLLRRTIAAEMGFVLPPVRIQDNLQLGADDYLLRIKELEVGSGSVRNNRLLAMDPKGGRPALEGEDTLEPAFGLAAMWVDPAMREEALFHGYTVVDPASVITTHLTELVRDNMSELMTHAATQKLLDDLPRDQQRLVGDLVPTLISVGGIQRILQSLLNERVSIRDLTTILEGVQEGVGQGMKAVTLLVAHVRCRLARQITHAAMSPKGYMPVVTLAPEWEADLLESLVGSVEDRHLALAPSKLNDFVGKLRQAIDAASADGEVPSLLVNNALRIPMRGIVERLRPSMMVLAQGEVTPRAKIKTIRTVR